MLPRFPIKNFATIVYRTIRYNLKIIFANKFVYFLSAAMFIFILVTVINVLDADSSPTRGTVFQLLLVPGILLVFYPITFGIQNDVDNRMIEILFGIPNYRSKVWLIRMILIFTVATAILAFLAILSSIALTAVPILEMIVQVMFPVAFLGCMAFFVSTLVKNGSGTSVVMVIFGMIFWVARDFFSDHRKWDIFLNPFTMPDNINEAAWAEIIFTNRVYLVAGIIIALLGGLLSLQKREKFLQ